jgi:CRP/FNR family transcriptional regulator
VEPFFCGLAKDGRDGADSPGAAREYPRGAVLFVEGQAPHGVYVLCRGRAKLYTCSADARVLITDIAGPGDVLGLSAVVSGRPYEVSARALDACRLRFIGREEFLRMLDERAGVAAHATRQLSFNYRTAHRQASLLGLAHSAARKLASVLLEHRALGGACDVHGAGGDLALTHEEIGQLIGASRETVTRLLGDFKRKSLIEVAGATLRVRDRPALEGLAHANDDGADR